METTLKPASTSALSLHNTIRLLTCNVKDVVDYDVLVTETFRLSIPIACFQECPPEPLQMEKMIRAFKSKGYTGIRFSTPTGTCSDIIFIKNDASPVKKEYMGFTNTSQGRGIIVYTYHVVPSVHHRLSREETPGDVPAALIIKVCTGQLESGGTGGGIRKSQIRDLNVMLGVDPNVDPKTFIIFAGDTNIPSWQTELNSITPHPRGWEDAWRQKGTSENEYTDSLAFNRMDRIWYHSPQVPPDDLRCISYDLFSPAREINRKGIVAEFSFFNS